MHISIPQDFLKILSMTAFTTHFLCLEECLGLLSMIYKQNWKKNNPKHGPNGRQ